MLYYIRIGALYQVNVFGSLKTVFLVLGQDIHVLRSDEF